MARAAPINERSLDHRCAEPKHFLEKSHELKLGVGWPHFVSEPAGALANIVV